jgi:hypothetical protein
MANLLIGDRGGRKKLLAITTKMFQAATVPHARLSPLSNSELHGRGVGWIDVHLLASAIVDGLESCGRPIRVCRRSPTSLE